MAGAVLRETLGEFVTGLHTRAEAFLFGRRSYQILGAHWPHVGDADDPVATSLNSGLKYVASRTLQAADWHNSVLLNGDVAEDVSKLKEQGNGEILVLGSSDLLQTFVAHDLVDTFHVIFAPVVLGTGKRLFGHGVPPRGMTLTRSQSTGTGVVIGTYERGGELGHGSFGVGGDDELGQQARGLR